MNKTEALKIAEIALEIFFCAKYYSEDDIKDKEMLEDRIHVLFNELENLVCEI